MSLVIVQKPRRSPLTLSTVYSFLCLVQHVCKKTHANGHTLDLVISNAIDHFVIDVKTTDPVISDHLAVHSTLHLEKPRFIKKVGSSRKLHGILM